MLRYGYDELGQLVREDNRYTGKSYTWKYDNAGNILNRKTYAYTIDALGTVQNTVIYGYDNGSWGDLLISFNGQSIAYDGIGNPKTWNGSALTWQGRRLMSYGANTYTYNADGIRTSKTVNGVEHIYHLSGTQILDEEWIEGNIRHLMVYVYDASGQPIGISHYTYNGTIVSENYYLLFSNIQGDIIGIYDSNGTRVVTYVYDAWGRILSTTGTGANTIGVYNPFRYRGYYYDTETSLYYLNSRYYDPNVGRFLNADGYINANGDLIGFNMFAYCGNNPVMLTDYYGYSAYKCGHNNNPDKCRYCKKEREIAQMAGVRYSQSRIQEEAQVDDDTPINYNGAYSQAQTITSLTTNAFALLLTVTSQGVDTTASMYVTGFGYLVTAPINIVQTWNNPNLGTKGKVLLTTYDVMVAASGVYLVYGMANWWNVTGWAALGISVVYTVVTYAVEYKLQEYLERRYYNEYAR